MAQTSMLHVRVDNKFKSVAAEKLASVGLTISDPVRILLTGVARDGGLPAGLTTSPGAYDAWFRAKVHKALEDDRPCVDYQQVMDGAQQIVDRKRHAGACMAPHTVVENSIDRSTMSPMPEDALREKLRKIEALYAGATTAGEKSAAGAAAERIRRRFEDVSQKEKMEAFKFSISDPWSRQLFTALCRRYGLKPFRYTRMHRQTVIVRAPASFINTTLWPEFEELSQALTSHLNDITQRIIREEVHEATQEAEEIPEPRQLR